MLTRTGLRLRESNDFRASDRNFDSHSCSVVSAGWILAHPHSRYCWRIQEVRANSTSWPKCERRVGSIGTPAIQLPILTKFMAAAMATCWRRVFARPTYRARRRPKPRTPGTVSPPLRPAARAPLGTLESVRVCARPEALRIPVGRAASLPEATPSDRHSPRGLGTACSQPGRTSLLPFPSRTRCLRSNSSFWPLWDTSRAGRPSRLGRQLRQSPFPDAPAIVGRDRSAQPDQRRSPV